MSRHQRVSDIYRALSSLERTATKYLNTNLYAPQIDRKPDLENDIEIDTASIPKSFRELKIALLLGKYINDEFINAPITERHITSNL